MFLVQSSLINRIPVVSSYIRLDAYYFLSKFICVSLIDDNLSSSSSVLSLKLSVVLLELVNKENRVCL